jgi:hypothetical protein
MNLRIHSFHPENRRSRRFQRLHARYELQYLRFDYKLYLFKKPQRRRKLYYK